MAIRASYRIVGGPTAAAVAREIVAHELAGEVSERTADDVRLLVSELATNSILHGESDEGATITLELVADGFVRIDVIDHGPGFAESRDAGTASGRGGWGLLLVERLADRWGIERSDEGTRVWFELRPPTDPDPLVSASATSRRCA